MAIQDVLSGEKRWHVEQADVIEFLRGLPADSVQLILGSPPYEKARSYLENGKDLGIARDTEEWVAWMVAVYREASRVCNGLVAFVVEGQTKDFRYSCGPALLMADLHRAGFNLRKPPIYHRVGIPGSGGPDYLRNDYEWIIVSSRSGRLPWSDNTACGHAPKWPLGGEMTYRAQDGTRRAKVRGTSGYKNGDTTYHKPGGLDRKVTEIANPGNVISQGSAGGGHLGSMMAHENEAPYPEDLAAFFIKSFCPPDGIVCDVFSGSGTTAAVAMRHGRRFIGCDVRQSQVDLSKRRILEVLSLEKDHTLPPTAKDVMPLFGESVKE